MSRLLATCDGCEGLMRNGIAHACGSDVRLWTDVDVESPDACGKRLVDRHGIVVPSLLRGEQIETLAADCLVILRGVFEKGRAIDPLNQGTEASTLANLLKRADALGVERLPLDATKVLS